MLDRPLAFGVLILAAAAAGSPQSPSAPERANLSGNWRLNPEESEDPREKMREVMLGPPGGGFRLGGPAAGRPPTGGPPMGGVGGRMGRRDRAEGDATEDMSNLIEAPQALAITHTDAEIVVLEKDGRMRTLHPNGQKYKDSDGGEVKTRWDEDRLIVEIQRGRLKISEAYRVGGDPRQLTVEIRLDGPMGDPVSFRRVYDTADAKPAEP